MPITTDVVSSNLDQGEVCNMSHLRQVGGFLRVLWFPPHYNWNIVESDIKHYQTNKQNIFVFIKLIWLVTAVSGYLV